MNPNRGKYANGIARQPGPTVFERWPLAVVAGCLAAQLFTTLPDSALLVALALLGLAACGTRITRPAGLAVLTLWWTLFQYAERAGDRLDAAAAGAVITVSGTVTSIPARFPDGVRFRFEPDSDTAKVRLPAAIRVSWYHEPGAAPDIAPGQRWRMALRLQPPWGAVNFKGADPERWLFAAGFGALGTVRAAEPLPGKGSPVVSREELRERVVRAIDRHLPAGAGRGVVRALAVADRSGLDQTSRQLLVDTGTAHLLAISGLHVGLSAIAGFWLLRVLLAPFGLCRRGRTLLVLASAGGLLSATGYAFLADLGVSTVRAVAMVAIVTTVLLSARSVHPVAAVSRAAAVVVLLDPFAPLGAGFWFSFIAVVALMVVLMPRASVGPAWRRTVLAQLAVTAILLPVAAAWFGLGSSTGLPANLLAIPWVSFFVVPPVLAGIAMLPLSEAAAAGFWRAGSETAAVLLWMLRQISEFGPAPLALNALDTFRLALAMAGAFILFLPSVLRWKWLALFLLAPLLLPARLTPDDNAMVFEVLDVGQGTAALVHTASGTLLYDSGPGDGMQRDRVRSAVLPAFGTAAPDRIVISHGDLDHAGGLGSLVRRFPGVDIRMNAAETARSPCTSGWSWSWGDTAFRALHPSPGLPYLGNDSSCVLSVTGPAGRILLAGDISKAIEQRLLGEGLAPHDVLLVPHHGSNSSSGPEFLAGLRPGLAIATAALGNRFGFPRDAVRDRYRAAGIPLLTTGECGALRVHLRGGRIERISSARRLRARVWRWPAASRCP